MRAFARVFAAALVCAVLLMGMAPRSFAGEPAAETQSMLTAINAVRAQFGLPAVGLDGRLMQAAQAYTQKLATEGRLTHGDFAGRMAALGSGYGYVAENLAAGIP